MKRLSAVLMLCSLGLAGCGRGSDPAVTRRALEASGYRDVSVTVRTGGGVVVAQVDARPPEGAGPDPAAEVVWRTLPVGFDQLVLVIVPAAPVLRYDELEARFGPRDPALDRGPAGDAGGQVRSQLLAVVALGAALTGAGLVAGTVLVRRGLRLGRERLAQAEGPGSGLGAGSPMADGSAVADEAGEMPS